MTSDRTVPRTLVLAVAQPDRTLRPVVIDLPEPTDADPTFALLQVTVDRTGVNLPLTRAAANSLAASIVVALYGGEGACAQ